MDVNSQALARIVNGLRTAKQRSPQSKTSDQKKVKTPGRLIMGSKGIQRPRRLEKPRRLDCTPDCLRGTPTNLSDCPNALYKMHVPENYLSCHEVHALLRGMGIDDPQAVNPCAKSAIRRGHLKVSGVPEDLEKVIYTGHMWLCGHEDVNAKLKHFLEQPPCGGQDYEDGSGGATILCNQCHGDDWSDEDLNVHDEIWSMYLTQVCIGMPGFDDGKYHMHCTECAGFGRCVMEDWAHRH